MALQKHSDRPESGFKDTIESIVITFLVAFMFRAYVVEAFEIPTGSMAPTLYGKHMELTCSECGYRFATEVPTQNRYSRNEEGKLGEEAVCPMCGHEIDVSYSAPASSGDRIVVQKYLYSLQEPKRWDVVVFKNPVDPSVNFIKRLVGLPGEAVWVIDGNIYTRPTGDAGAPWHIARKADRPEAQNAVWQPVYHNAYVPLDNGTDGEDRKSHPWACPWVVSSGEWDMGGRGKYRMKSASGEAKLAFDFGHGGSGRSGWYSYSAQYGGAHAEETNVEDIRLAATVNLDQGAGPAGFGVTLRTTARLDDMTTADVIESGDGQPPAHGILAWFGSDGKVEVRRDTGEAGGATQVLAKGEAPRMAPGGLGRRVELWYVDEEAVAWVDGKQVASYRFDGPASQSGGWTAEQLVARSRPRALPNVSITLSGSAGGVTLTNVDLDRDLYYASRNSGPGVSSGLHATLTRRDHERPEGQPIELESDEFFCMGDNSPWSLDGRYWSSVDPWVELRMLNDKMQRVGVVPRRLMMGRAFFVYFPAPSQLNVFGAPMMIVPNFGDMRMIH